MCIEKPKMLINVYFSVKKANIATHLVSDCTNQNSVILQSDEYSLFKNKSSIGALFFSSRPNVSNRIVVYDAKKKQFEDQEQTWVTINYGCPKIFCKK